eukprot:scaffold137_cov398-Prasinococcus_capsulatus_cf.AAC.30
MTGTRARGWPSALPVQLPRRYLAQPSVGSHPDTNSLRSQTICGGEERVPYSHQTPARTDSESRDTLSACCPCPSGV